MEVIHSNDAPDYAFMGFYLDAWRVAELFVIPATS